MTLEELTAKASSAVSAGGDFSKKVKFDFGDVGKLFIDGAAGNVDNSDSEADATVKVDWEDFQKLAAGQMDPTMAFMQGKLKVLGDMSVAMQLQGLMSKISKDFANMNKDPLPHLRGGVFCKVFYGR